MISFNQTLGMRRGELDLRGEKKRTKGASFNIRGEQGLFKVVSLRAYWKEADALADPPHDADEIVPPETEFNASTMYLHPKWDYVRAADDPEADDPE